MYKRCNGYNGDKDGDVCPKMISEPSYKELKHSHNCLIKDFRDEMSLTRSLEFSLSHIYGELIDARRAYDDSSRECVRANERADKLFDLAYDLKKLINDIIKNADPESAKHIKDYINKHANQRIKEFLE